MSSPKFVFFRPIGKTRWPPWPLICWDIFEFSSETAERNSTKLDRKQYLNVLYHVCVFRADLKNKMAAWPLIGWDNFDFSSETAEWNSTKLNRKQDLNVLYHVCVLGADWKNGMAALTSDWLQHFRLLLWNPWTEFNKTWHEARSHRPLPSLCFGADRKNKMAALTSDWLRHFRLLFWKLNGIQRNLTGSKIATSSTKLVFLGPIGKARWPPWPLIGWDIFDFSSETAEWNSTKLNRKQDLNVLYQVCVFGADWKNGMAALTSNWLRHFRLLFWKLNGIQRNLTGSKIATSSTKLCGFFFGRSEKRDGRPDVWFAETFSNSPLKPLIGIQRKLTGSKIATSSTNFVFFGPIRKLRWPLWPLIGRGIVDFTYENAERNSTKLDRKQDLNVLYQVCVFHVDQKTGWPPWPLIGLDIFYFSS